jgi:hypothetical protein
MLISLFFSRLPCSKIIVNFVDFNIQAVVNLFLAIKAALFLSSTTAAL